MSRNKTLRKQIQGELDVINEHLQKIAEEKDKPLPDKRGLETWEKDIFRHMRILEKLRAKLPGRRRE